MKGINIFIGTMLVLLVTISTSLILTVLFGSQLHELHFKFFPKVEKTKYLVNLEILNAKILDSYSKILVKNVSNYDYDKSLTIIIKCEDIDIYSKVIDLNIHPGKTYIITLNDFNREVALNKCKSNLFITISGNNLTSNSYFYGDVGIKIPISMWLENRGRNTKLYYSNYSNLNLSNVNIKIYDYNDGSIDYDKNLNLNIGNRKFINLNRFSPDNYHLYIIYLNGIDINECYYNSRFVCYK